MRRSPPPTTSAGAFALRFRLLMSYHDLTLRDIALATRNAVSTVGTWKNGRVPSSRATLARLAEIFHVSEEYLLTGRWAGGRPQCGRRSRRADSRRPGPAWCGNWTPMNGCAGSGAALRRSAKNKGCALCETLAEISPFG